MPGLLPPKGEKKMMPKVKCLRLSDGLDERTYKSAVYASNDELYRSKTHGPKTIRLNLKGDKNIHIDQKPNKTLYNLFAKEVPR